MSDNVMFDNIEVDQVIAADSAPETPAAPVLSDLLVEDVSIDGMCGVY